MSGGPAPDRCENRFLTHPVPRLFLSNALPMAVVMSAGGLLNVADGIFVGRFIGPGALAAVSLAFPVVMLLTALSALVGGGMAGLLARQLGAGARGPAGAVFAGAHGLALAIGVVLVAGALALGPEGLGASLGGETALAEPAGRYLRILLLGAPVQLWLALHADALRCEGRAGRVALLSVLVNLINIGANYVAIVELGLGVAGSALGTVAAQALGLVLVLGLRARDPALLPLAVLRRAGGWLTGWRQVLVLGLPLCLNFVGMALVSGTVLVLLSPGEVTDAGRAEIAAYGVATRVLGLAYLPLMAIALTTQSLTGQNAGAGRLDRARAALGLATGSALLWCLGVTLAGTVAGAGLGRLFSGDPEIVAAVAAILCPMTALYAISGPVLVLALHFQALGYPVRTAVLTLVRPWLLTPGLLVALAALGGTRAMWLAFPLADALLGGLAALVVLRGGILPPVPAVAQARVRARA